MGFDGAVPASELLARGPLLRARALDVETFDGEKDQPTSILGRIIAECGLSPHLEKSHRQRAAINGTDVLADLLAGGRASEADIYRAAARVLALPYIETLDASALVISGPAGIKLLAEPAIRLMRYAGRGGPATLLLAPDGAGLEHLGARLRLYPHLAHRIAIVAPSTLRSAVEESCRDRLVRDARRSLFDTLPQASALLVLSGWQGYVLGCLTTVAAILAVLEPGLGLNLAHVTFSLFFLACIALRLLASGRPGPAPRVPAIAEIEPVAMPRYTVLVALYKEADIVPELLVALSNLVWPRGKLEVKLVCEADDTETLDALRGQQLRPYVEVIEVPHAAPRTKPKALTYALQMSSGDLVVIYDAEDRPHPFQLVEAWQRFAAEGSDLACLQAPLAIVNASRGWLARMFAFEYSGLFRAMLPFLSERDLILPLGGTSNHFRRSALHHVGAWDPYNVTEDADLGMRLKRFGYRIGTITLPTNETAPESLREWLPQRTRWFKGWIQTWLVHMRDGRRLWRELGTASFVVSQILFAGLVLSALLHPMLFVAIAWLAWSAIQGLTMTTWETALFGIDAVNLVLGYGAFFLLGRRTVEGPARRWLPLVLLTVPIYWLLMSIAAWRAVLQLFRRPHHWEKTPHFSGRASVG